MAKVHITLRNAVGLGGASVLSKTPRAVQTITSSGSSQQSSISASTNEVAHIVVTGGDIFVAIGQNPTAASGAGDLMPAGSSREFGGLASGDLVALIDSV